MCADCTPCTSVCRGRTVASLTSVSTQYNNMIKSHYIIITVVIFYHVNLLLRSSFGIRTMYSDASEVEFFLFSIIENNAMISIFVFLRKQWRFNATCDCNILHIFIFTYLHGTYGMVLKNLILHTEKH